jgi:hypothetical protein
MGLLTVGRATLSLTIIAVVVTDDNGLGVDLVSHGAAEAVTRETHDGDNPKWNRVQDSVGLEQLRRFT